MIVFRYIVFAIVITSVTTIAPKSIAEEGCDCYDYPYRPVPPCFRLCYVRTAAEASASALESVLGFEPELAKKVSTLSELGIGLATLGSSNKNRNLQGRSRRVTTPDGDWIGNVSGVIGQPGSPSYSLVLTNVDPVISEYFATRLPVDRTTMGSDGGFRAWVSDTQIRPTDGRWVFDGGQVQAFPVWNSSFLTEAELEIIRNKMERISSKDFQRLVDK